MVRLNLEKNKMNNAAITSWDEERNRALREADRVMEKISN